MAKEQVSLKKRFRRMMRFIRRKRYIILPVALILVGVLGYAILTGGSSAENVVVDESKIDPQLTQESDITDQPLKGKTCVCFGDSITGNMQPPYDYPTVLAKKTGMKVINLGVGGTRLSVHPESDYGAFSFFHLADSIVTGDYKLQKKAKKSETISYIADQKYKAITDVDWSTVDYITICYGANDIKEWSNPLNDETNPKSTDTFLGALRYSIERIQAEFPDIQIVVISPLFRYWADTGEYSDEQIIQGVPYTAWVDAVLKTADEYDLLTIDMYKLPGFNRLNHSYYYDDGIHPNKRGLEVMAEIIAEKMEEHYLELLEEEAEE